MKIEEVPENHWMILDKNRMYCIIQKVWKMFAEKGKNIRLTIL